MCHMHLVLKWKIIGTTFSHLRRSLTLAFCSNFGYANPAKSRYIVYCSSVSQRNDVVSVECHSTARTFRWFNHPNIQVVQPLEASGGTFCSLGMSI